MQYTKIDIKLILNDEYRKNLSKQLYFFFIYFINGLKIKECSSKLAMGHLHHAVTSLVVDLKRLQPIRLTNKTDVNTQTF